MLYHTVATIAKGQVTLHYSLQNMDTADFFFLLENLHFGFINLTSTE